MSDFGKSRFLVTLAVTGSILAAGLTPVMAGEARKVGFDKSRLDAAQVDYSQYYRRGWRGNRGAAIAAGVGLGILGTAAIAASRPRYAEPVYGYGPVRRCHFVDRVNYYGEVIGTRRVCRTYY